MLGHVRVAGVRDINSRLVVIAVCIRIPIPHQSLFPLLLSRLSRQRKGTSLQVPTAGPTGNCVAEVSLSGPEILDDRRVEVVRPRRSEGPALEGVGGVGVAAPGVVCPGSADYAEEVEVFSLWDGVGEGEEGRRGVVSVFIMVMSLSVVD